MKAAGLGLLLILMPVLLVAQMGRPMDLCDLHGAVYIERESPQLADVLVYEESSEGSAEFWVFEEQSRTYADKPGLWYFVENRGMADFSIYVVEERGMADLSLFFTEIASFAGCQ